MGNILVCGSSNFYEQPPNPRYSLRPPTVGNSRPAFTHNLGETTGADFSGNLNPSVAPLASSSDLIIGIDFGTTFTGVAYAHAAGVGPVTTTAEMRRAADKVSVIKKWPNRSGSYTEKTPSVIAYHKAPPAWGGYVKPTDEPQVAHFKLGLQENIARHYQQHMGQTARAKSVLGGYLVDHNWKHPQLPHKNAVDFAGDYLTGVVQYVTTEALPNHFGERFLRNQKMSYVITVPAIWSDKAKEQTRQAAIAAGITAYDLTLITEPEAAALYCATLCDEVDLGQGDRFMVCDAGGGTVDLISYRVVSQLPFRVEECTVGTGAACGAIYLDRAFEGLIRRKFEGEGNIDDRRLADLVRQFDNSIKREFNPFDPSAETSFEISISGFQDMPHIGLRDGYLTLSRRDIQGVFDTIFNRILQLVRDQINSVRDMYGERMKILFLVGGLGSSLYLTKFLQSKLKGLVEVKQPETGYSAIMRGAVLYKLGLDFVKERVMRVSYGTASCVPFKQGVHPVSRRVLDFDGLPRCDGIMHWFAKKGVSLANGTFLYESFYSDYLGHDTAASYNMINKLWISEEDTPPKFTDKDVLQMHVKLSVDLAKLPADAWEKRWSKSGGAYRRVRYQLGLNFGPGGIEWRFLYKGKVIGSVNCDYS